MRERNERAREPGTQVSYIVTAEVRVIVHARAGVELPLCMHARKHHDAQLLRKAGRILHCSQSVVQVASLSRRQLDVCITDFS